MKKIMVLLSILICLALAACAPAGTPETSNVPDAPTEVPDDESAASPSLQSDETSLFATELTDLPEEYPREDAIANGDLVYSVDGYANDDKMSAFVEAVNAKKSAAIRITRYTDEGDPTIADVVFDGSKFTVRNDTTRDKFGPQELTQSEYLYMLEYDYQGRTSLILTNEADMTDDLFLNSPDQFLLKFWDDKE